MDCFPFVDNLTLEGGLKSKKVKKWIPPKPPKTMGVLGGQWRKKIKAVSALLQEIITFY